MKNMKLVKSTLLTGSLLSLTLVSVLTHEKMLEAERPIYVSANDHNPNLKQLDQLNRAIASAEPFNLFQDIEWEHKMALSLGDQAKSQRVAAEGEMSSIDMSSRIPAALPQKVSLLDELRYGSLAGKYFIKSDVNIDGTHKISRIKYMFSNEESGNYVGRVDPEEKPVRIADVHQFILQFKELMPVQFATAEMGYQSNGSEDWQLLNEKHQVVGHAKLSFDPEGHFLELNIQKF